MNEYEYENVYCTFLKEFMLFLVSLFYDCNIRHRQDTDRR